MIFLLVTLLALGILSMGSLGIDWGYASLVQARLETVAHSVALASTLDRRTQQEGEEHILEVLGLDASTHITRTIPDTSHHQVEVSNLTTLPLQTIFDSPYMRHKSSSKDSSKTLRGMTNVRETQKVRQTRKIKSFVTTELRPARQVGAKSSTSFSMPGAIPCVLTRAFWEKLSVVHETLVTMNASGEMLAEGRRVGHIGQYLTYVGQEDSGPKPHNKDTILFKGYAPIIQAIGEHRYVVGFGHIDIRGRLPHVSITVQVSRQASRNATTHLTGDLSQLTKEELTQIFEINQTLPGVIRAPAFISSRLPWKTPYKY